jgi:hypothetical protein
MMKRDRKFACLIYAIMLSISGCNNAFYEVDTKVELKEGANPPTFNITGNGKSAIFLMFGPFEGDYGKDGNPAPFWELDPKQEVQEMEVSKYSPFVYGQIPSGYIKHKPKDDRIPALLEGKEYLFYVHVNSANGDGICFRIQGGKAVRCR